jgi:hypothetical protein
MHAVLILGSTQNKNGSLPLCPIRSWNRYIPELTFPGYLHIHGCTRLLWRAVDAVLYEGGMHKMSSEVRNMLKKFHFVSEPDVVEEN